MVIPVEYSKHARAGLIETVIFRTASKASVPLFEGLVHGFISARMNGLRENRNSQGLHPLVRAASERLSEVEAGKEKWRYTRKHSFEVAHLAYVMAREAKRLNVPGSRCLDPKLCLAGGFVHDVGKTFLPMAIVVKELGVDLRLFSLFEGTRPTKMEIDVLRNEHLSAGSNFVRFHGAGEHIRVILDMVGLHHVSFNGRDTTNPSYPKLVKGSELSLHSRIAKTADFISAVLPRHYRANPWVSSFEDAIAYAVTVAGMELDPASVKCLITATQDVGSSEAAKLIQSLAHPGGQEAISDYGTVREYVVNVVRKDESFQRIMKSKADKKMHSYGKEIERFSKEFGVPFMESISA